MFIRFEFNLNLGNLLITIPICAYTKNGKKKLISYKNRVEPCNLQTFGVVVILKEDMCGRKDFSAVNKLQVKCFFR